MKEKIIGFIIGFIFWIIGLLIVLSGFGLACLPENHSLGVYLMLLGFIIIPPIRNLINRKLKPLYLSYVGGEAKNKYIKDKGYGLIKFLILFIALFHILSTVAIKDTSVNTGITNSINENKFIDNQNTKLISETVGIDEVKAAKIYETLISCGVGNITKITLFNENGTSSAYDIEAYGIPSIIIAYIDKKGNMREVYYDMKDIVKNGKRIAKISDYVLSTEDFINLRIEAEDLIKNNLNVSNSANFSNWNYYFDKNNVINITGNVEAQNLFGVSLTRGFNCQYSKVKSNDEISEKLGLKYTLKRAKLGNEIVYE